ncbi:MAG: FlgD immunoglobulin-like domain containing protein [Candidatus Cloacimonetes bacterium]|nr:FlgD immunoglobulin-like domain containing protein [Candidatus Cloacimonadota bacterium]
MKKALFTLMAILIVITLVAEVQKAPVLKKAVDPEMVKRVPNMSNRDVPSWEWINTPSVLSVSYYDYFPGSYCSYPIRKQTPEVGGGKYIAFQARQTPGAQRRIYTAYVNPVGEVQPAQLVTGTNISEGFPGIALDPVSGDPFFAWHAGISGNANLDVVFALDQWHVLGTPYMLSTPYAVWANPGDDEFIWPYVFLGPAPTYNEDGKRRIYILGNNATSNPDGNPSENVRLAYADFSSPDDLVFLNPDDWTITQIPQLDEWRLNNIRPYTTFNVSMDGSITIAGHTNDLDDAAPDYSTNDFLFVIENRNFGEGEWYTHTFDGSLPVENPDDYFDDPLLTDMRFVPLASAHNNVIFDDEGNIHFTVFYGLCLGTGEGSFYAWGSTAKHVTYEIADDPADDGNWNVQCVFPPDVVEDDDQPYLPWNPEGNGIEYDTEGNLIIDWTWPAWYHAWDDVFHEQMFRMAQKGRYILLAFADGSKSRLFNEGDDSYQAWAEVPEYYFYLSEDHGQTWNDPVIMNALDTPELNGMIPTYMYIDDDLEVLENGDLKVNLMFFDDNSFGSFVQENGENLGGNIMYSSFRITPFTSDTDDNNNQASPNINKISNYPNPFNPETTISYNVEKAGNVKVTVYNLKGQFIKTLSNEYVTIGEQTVTWNGTDENGKDVSSGVYFYKVETPTSTNMNKMLLLK